MKYLSNIPLCDKNTFRIGGNAAFYSEPQSRQEIFDILSFASEKELPVFILGKGSNVLISDDGWPGIVLNIASKNCNFCWDGDLFQSDGGVLLNTLVYQSISRGFSGAEELAGIPGTVGGAVVMNAGAYDTCIADTLLSVEYYDYSRNELVCKDTADLELRYRSSLLFGAPVVVLSAKFKFCKEQTISELENKRSEILTKRKSKQPLELPNCGSVFKRPVGNYAGTLIEQCGLKGLRIGDVEVSTKHANFIVNRGNGTATDVHRLIYTIQAAVYEQSGIVLEPEVIFIGEFNEPLFTPSNR
jgi:UDP-N-acetylmuramate dehydrogenase